MILTHCHADHDAGTFQKILLEQRVTVMTTKTIMASFVRKYSLVSVPSPFAYIVIRQRSHFGSLLGLSLIHI